MFAVGRKKTDTPALIGRNPTYRFGAQCANTSKINEHEIERVAINRAFIQHVICWKLPLFRIVPFVSISKSFVVRQFVLEIQGSQNDFVRITRAIGTNGQIARLSQHDDVLTIDTDRMLAGVIGCLRRNRENRTVEQNVALLKALP